MEDKQRIRTRSKLLISVALTLIAAGVLPLVAEIWTRPVYDYLFWLRGPLPPELTKDVVVVAIDETSFSVLERQWPWPRSFHATLLDSVFAAGASAVAFDILFADPAADEADDQAFAESIARHPNVVLAQDFTTVVDPVAGYEQIKIIAPSPILDRLQTQPSVGFVTYVPELDGYLRRLTLYFADGESMALAAVRAAGKLTDEKTLTANPSEPLWINFAGPARTVPTASYYQALAPEESLPPGFFKDKLVLVGLSTAAEANIYSPTADHFLAPFSRGGGLYMPGVEVHANAALNVINHNFLKSWTPKTGSIVGLIIGFFSAFIFLTCRPLVASMVFGIQVAVLATATCYLFHHGLVIAPVYLLIPMTVSFAGSPFIHYWSTYKQKAFIRKAFSTYLAPDLVNQLINNPDKLELGGEVIEGTVIFLDLSGFTAFSEKLTPKQLIELINRNLGACADVVLKWQGMIDKYIGDCIMAVWGVPISNPDHALKACLAVCDIQEKIKVLAEEEQKITGVSLSVRVGVNSGMLIAGNVGGGQHFNYTVLGNEVNLASRLEGTNKYYASDVIVSESTASMVAEEFLLRELDVIRVVGQKKPVKIFQLMGKKGNPLVRQDVESLFKAGRDLYTQREWTAAIEKFRGVLALSPEDGPSQKYIARCEEYAETPPPGDWDGVYQMMSK